MLPKQCDLRQHPCTGKHFLPLQNRHAPQDSVAFGVLYNAHAMLRQCVSRMVYLLLPNCLRQLCGDGNALLLGRLLSFAASLDCLGASKLVRRESTQDCCCCCWSREKRPSGHGPLWWSSVAFTAPCIQRHAYRQHVPWHLQRHSAQLACQTFTSALMDNVRTFVSPAILLALLSPVLSFPDAALVSTRSDSCGHDRIVTYLVLAYAGRAGKCRPYFVVQHT